MGLLCFRSLFFWVCAFLRLIQAVPLAASNAGHVKCSDEARVSLDYGTYVGTQLPNGVSQFLGMRFASPPLSDLRWKAPAPPETFSTPQLANKFGDICLGLSAGLDQGQSEDCLFVNVWKPKQATPKSKLPVWVFIQGGGYIENTNANYNGSEVVEKSGGSVIFVNFNYRVSLWGFLAGNEVREKGDLNVGFQDQRFLLEWVKNYIAKFGGDPDHVVIHGASAGAGSVALHLVANGGRDDKLFVGAIAESVFFPAQPDCTDLEWQFTRVSQQLECDNSADQLDCLRGKDIAALQAANIPSPFPGKPPTPLPLFYWSPCVDRELIPELPYHAYEKGNFVKIPVLFGDDTNEGSYFAPNASTTEEFGTFMQVNYPSLTDEDTARIVAHYPLQEPVSQHAAWFPSISAAFGEAGLTCVGVNILKAFQKHWPNAADHTWSYRTNIYNVQNDVAGLGVPHLYELPGVLGPDNVQGLADDSWYSYNTPMIPVLMGYWLSFVRTLSPNAKKNKGAPQWESWASTTSSNHSRLIFELNNNRMESVSPAQEERCVFWESLSTSMQQKR
ncbi:alpha/beta-hydrolase [Thozetella sp. PMI_491]|nr:alpha/beta-hydrolase [Thozetella sp. PMI_491]